MMMELRDVTKHYPQGRRIVRALNGVSLKIHAGEFVSIMGPSGSGKSTLMHLLGALDVPTTGEVTFRDKPLHLMNDRELAMLRRQRVGFIFQFFNLLPTLTAVENVACRCFGRSRSKAWPAEEQLERVGLGAPRISAKCRRRDAARRHRRALVFIRRSSATADGNLDSANSAESSHSYNAAAEGRRGVMVTHDRTPPRIRRDDYL